MEGVKLKRLGMVALLICTLATLLVGCGSETLESAAKFKAVSNKADKVISSKIEQAAQDMSNGVDKLDKAMDELHRQVADDFDDVMEQAESTLDEAEEILEDVEDKSSSAE